jgi:hypothetical protein
LNEGGCDTVYFTKEQLNNFRGTAYREFLKHRLKSYMKNPLHLIRKIHSVEDLSYLLRMAKMGLGMKSRSGVKTATSKDFIYGKRQYV